MSDAQLAERCGSQSPELFGIAHGPGDALSVRPLGHLGERGDGDGPLRAGDGGERT